MASIVFRENFSNRGVRVYWKPLGAALVGSGLSGDTRISFRAFSAATMASDG